MRAPPAPWSHPHPQPPADLCTPRPPTPGAEHIPNAARAVTHRSDVGRSPRKRGLFSTKHFIVLKAASKVPEAFDGTGGPEPRCAS